MEKKIIIERINNRMNTMFKEFSYCNDTNIYNAYVMVLNWWMDETSNHPLYKNFINIIYNAERIDALDFFSSTSFAIVRILQGKTSFNIKNIVSECKEYINVDGIMVQTHNEKLMALSIMLIDYIFECRNEMPAPFLSFSKVSVDIYAPKK